MDHASFILGCWRLGGAFFGADNCDTQLAILQAALDRGITAFDSAYFYGQGEADRRLSRVISSYPRSDITLHSKAGLHWQGRNVVHDASPDQLKRTLINSLDILHCDYLDYFYLHWPDPHIPIQTSLYTLAAFQEEGLCRHIGLCNCTATQLTQALSTQIPFVHQLRYNPLQLQNKPLLEMVNKSPGCSTVIISLFEQGLLLSDPNRHFGKKDWRRRNSLFGTPQLEQFQQQLCQRFASSDDRAAYLINWLFDQAPHSQLCVGLSSSTQLKTFDLH
ncbi:MAG: aldo/keto reductase [bacterium]